MFVHPPMHADLVASCRAKGLNHARMEHRRYRGNEETGWDAILRKTVHDPLKADSGAVLSLGEVARRRTSAVHELPGLCVDVE